MAKNNGADFGPWNALIVFMVFVVVFCNVFPFRNDMNFFGVGNLLFEKVSMVSDFLYDGVRDVLSLGDIFTYTDEVYCMRVRFVDNGVDDYPGSYYADFLVNASKPNHTWTMVYCNLPDVRVESRINNFRHSYVLTRDVDDGGQCCYFVVLSSTIDHLSPHGLDFFVDSEKVENISDMKLTYKSYIYNIRKNALETRYDFYVDSKIYG